MPDPSSDPVDSADSSAGSDPDVYCRSCGEPMAARAETCPACGTRQQGGSSLDSALDDLVEGGNPFVAAALSVVYPGLGQIYNRELERGIAFMVASFVAALSVVVLVGLVLYPAILVYAVYDAYVRAERGVEPGEPAPTSR